MGHCSRRRSVSFLFRSTKRGWNEFPLYQKVDLLLHIHGTSLLFIGSINFLLFPSRYLPFPPCDRPRTRDRIAWINLPLFHVGLFFPHGTTGTCINQVLGSHRQLVRGPLPGCQGGWTSI